MKKKLIAFALILILALGVSGKTVFASPAADPEDTPPTTNPPAALDGYDLESIATGVKLEWPMADGDQYYRVFRSTTPDSRGIGITDFAITTTCFIDVNVEPDTTYYYTIAQVLADADPWNDLPEILGSVSPPVDVTTNEKILEPNEGEGEKHFILMKLNNPNMNVDGIIKEIDPGRGTRPINLHGRVLLPIRSIIETIGGTVGWESSTRKITLVTANYTLFMWLDKMDLVINGVNSKMDVAPISVNGRTMVPVRFAAENSGCVVEWLKKTQEIVIVYYLPAEEGG